MNDAIEAMKTTLPPPCLFIDGTAARVIANAPPTCVASTRLKSSKLVSASGFFK